MIKYIKLANWKGLNTTIVFDRLTYLSGPNGSGKSAVIQAIQWALNGEVSSIGRQAGALSTLMSADRTVVTLQVEIDGTPHTITRSMVVQDENKVRSTVKFDNLEGAKAKAMIDLTVQPLTWMLDQKALLSMTPADRRKNLLDLILRGPIDLTHLGLPKGMDPVEYLQKRNESIKDDAKFLRKEVKRLESLTQVQSEGLLPLEALEPEIQRWESKRDEAKDALRVWQGDRESVDRKRKDLEKRLKEAEKALETVREEIAGLPTPIDDDTIAGWQQELEELGPEPEVISWTKGQDKEIARLEKTLTKIESEGKILRKILDEGTKCPIDDSQCPRDWSTSNIPHRLEKGREKYRTTRTELDAMLAAKAEAEESQAAHTRWEKKALTLRTNIAEAESKKKLRKSMDARERDLARTIGGLVKDLGELPTYDPTTHEAEVETLQRAIQEAQENLDRLTAQRTAWATVNRYQKDLEEARKALERIKLELGVLQETQASVIDTSFSKITKMASSILKDMGLDGILHAELEKKNITLKLERPTGSVDLLALSQGEIVMVWLAIAAALMANHNGLKVLTLEGAELSHTNLRRVMETARKIKQFDNLILASWVVPVTEEGKGVEEWQIIKF